MNEGTLQARIAELNQQRANALAAVQMLNGAIGELEYQLKQIRDNTVKIDENQGND